MKPTDSAIHLLPDHLINQIAAGEVIERPASVVKELLDNSLDADASQIDIEIERGGTQLIRITDNGHGIRAADLSLAITRHATSKLMRLSDLQSLLTMGFRGEALPSIAAVSRMTLISRHHDAEHAWKIQLEKDAHIPEPSPASHPFGTTVECRDLFFNVPARRKYLRAERTEFYQILQWVRQAAISHHRVGFVLRHNGRVILRTPACGDDQLAQRVRAIFGNAFIDQARYIEVDFENLAIKGWVGLSSAAKTINDSQFVALNGRVIRDKRITHALNKAYEPLLPSGRHAVYCLMITMDPAQVDVNVHPAKTEVRFVNTREIHDAIFSSVSQALGSEQMDRLSGQQTQQQIGDHQNTSSNGLMEEATRLRKQAEWPSAVRERVPAYQRRVRQSHSQTILDHPRRHDPVLPQQARQVNEITHLASGPVKANDIQHWQLGEYLLVKQDSEERDDHGNDALLLFHRETVLDAFCKKLVDEFSTSSRPLLFPITLTHEALLCAVRPVRNKLAARGILFLERDKALLLVALPARISPSLITQDWQALTVAAEQGSTLDSFLSAYLRKEMDEKALIDAFCRSELKNDVQEKRLPGRILMASDLARLLDQSALSVDDLLAVKA